MYEGTKFGKLIQDTDRITILVPNFSEYSGNGRVAEIQARGLVEQGKEVQVITLEAGFDPDKYEILELGSPNIPVIEKIYFTFLFNFSFIKMFRAINAMKNDDMVISHFHPLNWLGMLSKIIFGAKYVYWYHGFVPPELYPKLHERWATRLVIFATRLATWNVDHAVSVSESSSSELKDFIGLSSEVIYNQPDLRKFSEEVEGPSVREELGLGNSPVMLYVGRITPRKGIDILLDVFDEVQKTVPEATLVIVGKHTFEYYSEQVMKQAGDNVLFTGFVSDEDLPQYYAIADVYTTCSKWEAHNVPVLEAQASGVPVVAFDYQFFREQVNEDGSLVEPGDTKSFSKACIEKLYTTQ